MLLQSIYEVETQKKLTQLFDENKFYQNRFSAYLLFMYQPPNLPSFWCISGRWLILPFYINTTKQLFLQLQGIPNNEMNRSIYFHLHSSTTFVVTYSLAYTESDVCMRYFVEKKFHPPHTIFCFMHQSIRSLMQV